MPNYISEFNPVGDDEDEFIEVALPAGTDPSDFLIYLYDENGAVTNTFSLGTSVATMGGHDVYLIDENTPGFEIDGGDGTGNMFFEDAIALVNDGNVEQFLSYYGNTVTATAGPASGQTSTNVSDTVSGQSIQSNDGGATYFDQGSANPGSIPACYGPGTLIETSEGLCPIETLRVGDTLVAANGETHVIKWMWQGTAPLDGDQANQAPILIQRDALGVGKPVRDLVVSGQHRILLGGQGALPSLSDDESFVPAKALTKMKGIRAMRGKKQICWYHIACATHLVLRVQGVLSESLLVSPVVRASLNRRRQLHLGYALPQPPGLSSEYLNGPPARPCLSVAETHRMMGGQFRCADAGLPA